MKRYSGNDCKKDLTVINKGSPTGITLIALVVTIVVLLILAGITIQMLFQGGIIDKTFTAKEKYEISKLREKIEIIQTGWWVEKNIDSTVDLDDLWERLIDGKIITGKEDIEGPEKEGENDVYLLDTTEGYIVEIIVMPDGSVIIGEIIKADKMPPKIKLIDVVNKTSSSIEVEVTVNRLEDGKISYYYKKEKETNYQKLSGKQNTTEVRANFTGLEQNQIYQIKVVAENKKGKSEKEVNVLTGELEVGVISQKGETIWSEGKASIELETTNTNLILKYQIGGIEESGWLEYKGTIGNLGHRDTVYAILTDGTNYGEAATITIRDGEAPNVSITKGNVNTSSIEVTASATDAQWGMPESPSYSYFIKETSESIYPAAKYTGTNTSYTFSGLTQNTSYDIKVTVNDKAGNTGEKVLAQTTTETVGGASGDLATGNIIASSPTWDSTSHTASITLSTSSGLQIQWQKGGISGTWTTGTSVTDLNHNDTVYARLWDGTNGGSEASVTIKDGTKPEATITLGATSVGIEVDVTATVTHSDAQSGIKIESCKWVYNTEQTEIGTTASSYTGGTFSSNGQTINLNASLPGTYYLHVLTTDMAGNVKETISDAITVRKLATGITLNNDIELTGCAVVTGGESWINNKQLVATLEPEDVTEKEVTWTSSNPEIATVDHTGLVKAGTKGGEVTITATTKDGSNLSKTCKITTELFGKVNENKTAYTDSDGNTAQIPDGYAVGTSENVNKVIGGLVAQDNEGNQFVWIPVGDVKKNGTTAFNITLGRYDFKEGEPLPETPKQTLDNYSEDILCYGGNGGGYELLKSGEDYNCAKDLASFLTNATVDGGYWFGRYEASYDSQARSKYDEWPKTNLFQPQASLQAQTLKTTGLYQSDLINGYSWDTAIIFIEKSGHSGYANYYQESKKYFYWAGRSEDKVCNIYEMAENNTELSTEVIISAPIRWIIRGGSNANKGGQTCRRLPAPHWTAGYVSYRCILFRTQ